MTGGRAAKAIINSKVKGSNEEKRKKKKDEVQIINERSAKWGMLKLDGERSIL